VVKLCDQFAGGGEHHRVHPGRPVSDPGREKASWVVARSPT
jgi:hypothetical protein